MTAEGPKAGLTRSRALSSARASSCPRCRPASPDHRRAAAAGDGVKGGFGRGRMLRCLKPFSQGGAEDRGCHVDLSHGAATPVGMRVTAQVELVAVEGRKLRFKLECQDEKERRRAPRIEAE